MVQRFVGMNGIRVGIMCQDSYFLAGTQHKRKVWDCSESLDHDMILKVLQLELSDTSDTSLDCIIFEGFKAFHDERVAKLLSLLIWLDVPEEVVRKRRMKNKNCTEQEFADQIWFNHQLYEDRLRASQYDQSLQRLCGMEPPQKVLDAAVAMISKQNPLVKSTADAVVAAAKHPRPQRPREEQSPARQVFMSANRSCRIGVHDSVTCGGFCCKEMYRGYRSGKECGRLRQRLRAMMLAPHKSSQAPATPPADPESWGGVEASEPRVIHCGTVRLAENESYARERQRC